MLARRTGNALVGMRRWQWQCSGNTERAGVEQAGICRRLAARMGRGARVGRGVEATSSRLAGSKRQGRGRLILQINVGAEGMELEMRHIPYGVSAERGADIY